MITLSELWIYPLKSAGGTSLSSSYLDQWGLQGDRTFMLVSPDGHFLSQRKLASLTLIQVKQNLKNASIIFTTPSNSPLTVDPLLIQATKEITIWGDTFQANSYTHEVNQWFSYALGLECELVSMKKDVKRQVDLDFAKKGNTTAFSDGFPLLLISEASLNDLNNRLKTPVNMNRFRPNLVIKGCTAFEEDTWKTIQIGDIVFDVAKPCSRCNVPNINQETAVKEQEPMKTLATYRRGAKTEKNKVFFGQNLVQQNQGKLSLGEAIIIIERR